MNLIHLKSGSTHPSSQSSTSRYAPLLTLRDEINHLFDDTFSIPRSWIAAAEKHNVIATPSVDVYETDKGYTIRAELPGLDAKQVDISSANGFLTIKGEKTAQTEEKHKNYLRRETSYGQFERIIALPEAADDEKAQATFKNGVLTIEMPKKSNAQAGIKKITVSDAS